MQLGFRLNIQTLCLLSGAALALFVLNDLRSLNSATEVGPPIVQDRVVTKELVIADDQGQTRVRLGNSNLNAPALSLYDRSGQERGLLRLNENDVPSLRLFDSNGTLRSGMGFAQNDLTPHLWFFTDNGLASEILPSLAPRTSVSYTVTPDALGSSVDYSGTSVRYLGSPTNCYETTITWQDHAVSDK